MCNRTVVPAEAAASRLRRPRMCDGGVATWNRSSGPSPRALTQWRVPCDDRAVRVAHGLRQPRRARAEDEDGVGVIADHRTDRSTHSTERLHVDVGHGQVPTEQLDARAVGDAMHRRRELERVANLEVLPRRTRSSTAAAPSLLIAWTAHEELDAVAHHHGDPIARCDADAAQVLGVAVRESVQLDERPPIVARQHGVPCAEALGDRLEARVHQRQRHLPPPRTRTFAGRCARRTVLALALRASVCEAAKATRGASGVGDEDRW